MGIKGNIMASAPVKSTRIRVGRSISGFGLSPGITKQQRLEVESLMKTAFGNLEGEHRWTRPCRHPRRRRSLRRSWTLLRQLCWSHPLRLSLAGTRLELVFVEKILINI